MFTWYVGRECFFFQCVQKKQSFGPKTFRSLGRVWQEDMDMEQCQLSELTERLRGGGFLVWILGASLSMCPSWDN